MSTATDLLSILALGGLVYAVFKSGMFNNLQIPSADSLNLGKGDTGGQTGKGSKFHVVGDVDCTPATCVNMAKGNPDLAINVGDFSYKCADPDEWWNTSLKACAAMGNKNIAVIGNHDVGEDAAYLKIFGPNQSNKWQYIKKMGAIAFVGANTEDVDLDELEQLLTKAQNDPTVKMIVILQRKTCFLPKAKPLKPDASKEFHALYKRFKKVKLGFWGHNHFYARLQPVDGIQYVTVGNGGHNPGKGSSARGSISNQLGVCKCTVSGGPTISCQEVLNDGTVIDTFTVSPTKLPTGGQPIDGVNSSDTGDGANEEDNAANYVKHVEALPTPYERTLVSRFTKSIIYLPPRRR